MRVYELAKELGMEWKEIQKLLAEQFGHEARSHSSSLPAEVVRKVRRHLRPEPEPPPPPPSPPPEPAPPPEPKKKKPKHKKARPEAAASAPSSAPALPPSRAGEAEPLPSLAAADLRPIRVMGTIAVKDLAEQLGADPVAVVKSLMKLGVMASLHQRIGPDVAELVAAEHGRKVEAVQAFAEAPAEAAEEAGEALHRPPVVTVMGHVDHGKTTLLDRIRKTNVAEGEAGGITQHIGASVVETPKGRVVFVDTPGHEAFTAMRARGAGVTDIVVLVVAADDGVMPQTVEAIHHAQAANVPIVVAITKVDLPGAQPDRIRQQLSEHNLLSEEWGGQTIMVEVSGKTGKGIDRLLEMLLLQAEILELKASREGPARATVLEASLEKGRGPVATVLVRRGTLRVGDPFVCGTTSGKVRALLDDRGRRISEAGPSTPVQVLGLDDIPVAGDSLEVVADERAARDRAKERASLRRAEDLPGEVRVRLEDLQAAEEKEMAVVLKADARGSVEAIRDLVEKIGGAGTGDENRVRLKVIHDGVGGIVDSDVMLAAASKAIVIGFNVRPTGSAEAIAKREGVEIRTYTIIYKMADEIRSALLGLLEPEYKEETVGRAEVRATFKVPRVGTVAGCYVRDGVVRRTCRVRVVRDGVQVADAKVSSLKRFKDDAREVQGGYECGIGLEAFQDLKVGDVLEFYERVEVKPEVAATA